MSSFASRLGFALLVATFGAACDGGGSGGEGGGGTGGMAGMGGTGGMAGSAGAAGMAGTGGGGTGGSLNCEDDFECHPELGEDCACDDCIDTAQCGYCDGDGTCNDTDACTCEECWDNAVCLDTDNCLDDGVCDGYSEGCFCADCAGEPACRNFMPGEVCANGVDDDGDLYTDCADEDCMGTPECGMCIVNGMCDFREACTCDECDADAYCSDPTNCFDDGICDQFNEGCVCADCALVPNCAPPPVEDCTNQIDDDADGFLDCKDPDCALDPACQEDCSNGLDDDLDGLPDCMDTDCAMAPACGYCEIDGACTSADACTCAECAADPLCSDPLACSNDGICVEAKEGCQCVDCAGVVPNCP